MIQIRKLDKYFYKGKTNENHVLRELDLTLPQKGLVCILGESGSGKTTLLNVLGGLDTFGSGTLQVDETILEKYNAKVIEHLRNEKFGYIFQNYYLLQEYTVAYNIKLALNVFDLTEEEKDARVEYVLDVLDMTKYKKKLVSQLSGGQQQRVSIARALVKSPQIILADEPTGNLDEENTLRTMGILKSIAKECLVILVSHEKNIAHFFADRIIEIEDGSIRRDYINQAQDSYEKIDDANIYLRDMERTDLQAGDDQIHLYGQREQEHRPIHLNIAWKDGKLYIQSLDGVPLMLEGDDSGCQMLDTVRPKLEQSEMEEIRYDLPRVQTKRRADLSGRQIWQLACENIRIMGRRRRFMSGILLVTSVLLVLALADYMMKRSVDLKDIVTEDSHYVHVELERSSSGSAEALDKQVAEYFDRYIEGTEYADVVPETGGILSLSYDGFQQIHNLTKKIRDFSAVSVEHLKKSDLIEGKMPEKWNEIVVDRWLLDRFRAQDNLLGELYNKNESFVGMKAETIVNGQELTIVGISDTNEPTVYMNKDLMMSMNYGNWHIISDQDLKKMYPEKYSDLQLTDAQTAVSEQVFYDEHNVYEENRDKKQKMQELSEAIGHTCINQFLIPDKMGINYVLSGKNCDAIRLYYIEGVRKFKFYTEDPEKAIGYFKNSGKEYSDYFKVSATRQYESQIKQYEKEQNVRISGQYIVALTVFILSVLMIYFTVKSNALNRSEELTVYRLLGISCGSIMKSYVLEMLIITAYSCIPAVLITGGVIKFISSVPSLEIYLIFPWWLALVLLAVLFGVNILLSILPVYRILHQPPAQLAQKMD